MNLKSDFYYAVLKDTANDVYVIQMVTKDVWDNEKMLDDPEDLDDYPSKLTLPGYTFEISEMNGDSCIDMIERKDGQDVVGLQLEKDLKRYGYTLSSDLVTYLEHSSNGIFQKI